MSDPKATTPINDHDLLIRIDERTTKIDLCLRDHLKHHWVIFTIGITILAGLVVSVFV